MTDFNFNISTDMERSRLIVILRGIPKNSLKQVLDALYEGGIRLAEITYDGGSTIPHTETAEMISLAAEYMEGKMHIGAGTVLTKEQVALTKSAGGSFIVSPNTDTDVIGYTKSEGLYSCPGAMTVSEIVSAIRAGADWVKLFPVSVLGPDFIHRVLAPLPEAKLLAVSGPNLENIPSYIAAGAYGFGIGGAIANGKLCAEGRYDKIRENASLYAGACIGKNLKSL